MITVKLRTRIIIGLLLIVGVGFYYLTSWVLNELRPHYLKSMEETLVDVSVILSSLATREYIANANNSNNFNFAFNHAAKRQFSAKIYDYTKEKMNLRVYITDLNGIVLFDSNNGKDEGKDYSKWNDVYLTLKGSYGARSSHAKPDDPTSSWLYVASPIIHEGNLIGSLSVGKPTKSINLFVLHARNKIIIAGFIAGTVVTLLGIFLSTWVTWPVRKLTQYARTIRDGKSVALPQLGTFNQMGHSEIGILGSALDEMREALEGKKYIEKYIQTLTHEIKSPLSAISGAAELLHEEIPKEKQTMFIQNIQKETKRIQSFLERLLLLSSLENRRELKQIETIDITSVISEVMNSLHPQLERKKIITSIKTDRNIFIKGEKFLIRQAIVNLIQNAVDFSPKSGTIEISAEMDTQNTIIKIIDTGSGIPDFAQKQIFNRFYSLQRPDTNLKSTGLGLSFVKEVALLHNGKIEIHNLHSKGAQATLILRGEL